MIDFVILYKDQITQIGKMSKTLFASLILGSMDLELTFRPEDPEANGLRIFRSPNGDTYIRAVYSHG